MGKAFEKQIKAIEDQREKQFEAIKEYGKQLIKSHVKREDKIFDELSYTTMDEMKDLSRKTDLNNLIYFFKSKDSSLITVVGFKAPLHFYKKILNGNTKLSKAEENQEQFKSTLNEITRRNFFKKIK